MAITTTEATQIKKLVAAMFNLAPSAAIYNDMVTSFEGGANSLSLLATNLSASGVYQNQLAGLDNVGLANKLMTSLGLTAGTTAGDAAYDYFITRLGDGVTLDQVAVEAVTYLADDTKRNAAFDDTVTLLNNKVTVIDALIDSGIVAATTADLNYIATVTADTATVTASTNAIAAANPALVGQEFTLTAADNVFIGTTKNDTITAAAGTLGSGDIIIDETTTDNDTLNVTYKAADIAGAATPTITGIENINVNIDAFDGTAITFDATNVSGATITLSSSKLGFNGAAGVDEAGTNNVTAGTGVTTLTLDELTTGMVNAGSATTVNADSDAATDTVNVTVNGNVALNTTTGLKTAITTTAASDIDYDSAAGTTLTTVAGSSNNTLSMVVADIVSTHTVTNNSTGTLTLSVTDTGSFDATKFDVDTINLEVSQAGTATVATGANITAAVAQDSLVVAAAAATAATNTVTLTTGTDLTTVTTFTNIATANIIATADITIDDLDSATQDVNISGTADVEVTTTDAAKVDASGLTGALTLTVTTASAEVLGGTGNNDVTLGEFDSSFVGQAGDDTVTVAATSSFAIETGNGTNTIEAGTLSTGTLAVTGGTGVETVKFDSTIAAATIAMDGGAGNDIVLVGDGLASTTDLDSVATWAVENFEVLAIKDAAASSVINQVVTVNGSQLDGFTSVVIQGPATGTSDDTFQIDVTADEATTDLSALVVGSVAKTTITITGAATADTIKATNGNDVIVTSGGKDVIDISQGGSDTITIAEGESASTAMVSITGFNITDSTSASDILDLDATTASADTAATGAVDVKAAIAGGTGSETVTVSINASGIATLGGADASAIDTLAEWIAVMKTDGVLFTTTGDDNGGSGAEAMTSAAFQFGGNTYVMSAVDADNAAGTGDVTFDVIELVGVTGADALATSAGSYDIVLG